MGMTTQDAWANANIDADHDYTGRAGIKPKVKPLEWRKSHFNKWNGDWHTIPSEYTVRCADENGWKWSSNIGSFGYCGSDEEAKAAAQADYERRILSALA